VQTQTQHNCPCAAQPCRGRLPYPNEAIELANGHVPSHLGLPAADAVLEDIVEGLVPVQRRVSRGRTADAEVHEGVVVGLPVEVLRL
jgi:hypothetical protein